ncbi:MAG: hypothetical protein ACI9LM_000119 [Alteromonadaceae bacterium]|jgi:hypothetical protein
MLNQKEKSILQEALIHINSAKGFNGNKCRNFWLGAAVAQNHKGYRDGSVSLVLMDRLSNLIYGLLKQSTPLKMIVIAEWNIESNKDGYRHHCHCKGNPAIECVFCGAMRDNTVSFKLMERLYDLIFKRLEGHRPLHLLSKRGV